MWSLLKKLARSAGACALNHWLFVPALIKSLALFDTMVTHFSPALVLPQWRALPFIGAAFFGVGVLASIWSSRWWETALPAFYAYFVTLGNFHFGADYYPETLWDYAGWPTGAQIVIGALAAALATAGWSAARRAYASVRKKAA